MTARRDRAAAQAADMASGPNSPAALRKARKDRTATPSQLQTLAGMEGAAAGRRRQAREAATAAAANVTAQGHGRSAARDAARDAAWKVLAATASGRWAAEGSAHAEMAALAADALAADVTSGLAALPLRGEAARRMRPADVVSIARQGVSEALAAGGKAALAGMDRQARAEAAADLAADVAAWLWDAGAAVPPADLIAQAQRATRRQWGHHPSAKGRSVVAYLKAADRRADLADVAPAWAAAPSTEADLADLGHGRTGHRARWMVAAKREASRILKARQRAALAAQEALGTPEARQALRSAMARQAMAAADLEAATLADHLAAAGRPLSTRARTALAAELDGMTSRDRAKLNGTTPAAERKNAERGRADLLKRYPEAAARIAERPDEARALRPSDLAGTDLAAELSAARKAAQAAANEAAADRPALALARAAEGATARQWGAQHPSAKGRSVVAYLKLAERAGDVWAATQWADATGRLMAARPTEARYVARPLARPYRPAGHPDSAARAVLAYLADAERVIARMEAATALALTLPSERAGTLGPARYRTWAPLPDLAAADYWPAPLWPRTGHTRAAGPDPEKLARLAVEVLAARGAARESAAELAATFPDLAAHRAASMARRRVITTERAATLARLNRARQAAAEKTAARRAAEIARTEGYTVTKLPKVGRAIDGPAWHDVGRGTAAARRVTA